MSRPGIRIRVAGRPAHYDRAGAGPPVVLVPGLGLSTRFYEPLLAAFARAGLDLIVPDLPGFGRTSGSASGHSVPELADWLLRFADALELERPAWLGHSVGCQIALRLAATRPERAAALVLAAPTGAPVRLRLTRQLVSLPRAAVREPLDLILAVIRDYVRVLPSAYLGTWLRGGRDRPMEILPAIECPVLLCAGDRDPICGAMFLRQLAEGIPGARIAIIPGGGHGLPRDSSQRFTEEAAPFLRRAATVAAQLSAGAVEDAGRGG